MLTYLDGMKWNCLAQRYLYTSTTAIRDLKIMFKPTVCFKMMDVTCFFLFGTQKMQVQSCSVFAAITIYFLELSVAFI